MSPLEVSWAYHRNAREGGCPPDDPDEAKTPILIPLNHHHKVHNSLTAVTAEVKAHKERLTSLENVTSEWTTSLQVLKPMVASLRNVIAALQAKCTDLECHSRRSNLRLVGIPEGMEGTQPTKFIAEALQEIFSLCEPPLLSRAHRTLAARPAEGQQPKAFVICFHRFDIKEDILRKAIQAKQLKFKDRTVHIFPDFPPEKKKRGQRITT
ncbi:putative transposase element L1Md-A101/L1Md-A102/L1Md-A2 [Labeo rohita]|uniref:Putative transposase element L1Md-A101/L1Md-A102/L1Md-A2 n=1 Tax=Labeo rohita TaxID=84645 RepID=A0A498MB30_LABRO|nr:putative transposase element L1Md-A101/L1Md-A102/L1Md-A2 [Labeo rohita]